MKEPPKSTALVVASLVLALFADLLFRGAAWGVNIGIWALLLGSAVILLGRFAPLRLRSSGALFGAAVIVFALLFALRDSNSLKIANGMALSLCLGAMILPVSFRSLRESSVGQLVVGTVGQLAFLPKEFADLAGETHKEKQWSPATAGRGKAVGRGLLLATPLLLVFGALFASADAIFKSNLENLFHWDLNFETAWAHTVTFLISLMVVGGLLHRIVLYVAPTEPPVVREAADNKVGIIEIGIVLGSLALLFGSFLMVQFRYLFAGRDMVVTTAGLSYAEYARGGFFELVWVAALALIVLIGSGAILRRERPADEIVYRWLGRVMVAMVFCIVGSALMRMKLYTSAFGLTELRVYSTVFMGWLAIAFAWMLVTTLAGRPQRFAFGSFVGGLLTIFCVNLLNPDALIVRTNLAKPNADVAYLRTLSDDAVVTMKQMAASIPAARRETVQKLISERQLALASSDWREMNLARWSLMR